MPTKACQRCGKPLEPGRTSRARVCWGGCFRATEADGSRRRRALYSTERKRAYIIVQSALQRGDLTRGRCEVCEKPGEAHHDDYAQPLNIRWLCRSHHRQHHARFGKAANAFASGAQ